MILFREIEGPLLIKMTLHFLPYAFHGLSVEFRALTNLIFATSGFDDLSMFKNLPGWKDFGRAFLQYQASRSSHQEIEKIAI